MWTRRGNNSVADYLCNRTMDIVKGTWREERQKPDEVDPSSNIVIFSDGGTRTDCSASAWVLCVVETDSHGHKLVPVNVYQADAAP